MKHTILIIDDEEIQARNLAEALQHEFPDIHVVAEWREESILNVVVSLFYSIALVDLRMDRFKYDGFAVLDLINDVNPYAKVIAVSAYTGEYIPRLQAYMSDGKLLAISDKARYETWIPELKRVIEGFLKNERNPIAVQVLENSFAEAKNEEDAYKKGKMFEDFMVNLFRQMGFIHIDTRKRDSASNEIDLVIRNDVDDPFFNKFGRYFYVECKNKPGSGVDKNDFIVFSDKIASSSGCSVFGIIATTGEIKKTVKSEALKDCKSDIKVIFLTSNEILRIIHTPKMIDEFKEIIDSQVLKYEE